jgi:hypothetical protein
VDERDNTKAAGMITTNPELEKLSYEDAKKDKSLLDRWRKFQSERDYEFAATSGIFRKLKPCVIMTPTKTNKLYYKLGKDKVYLDYAPHYGAIFSCFTPYGISNIDAWFARQIQGEKVRENFKYLKRAILTCPHLHPVIRNNLYQNLLNYVR